MDARARIGMVTLSLAVVVGSPAVAEEDRRAPVGGAPATEAGADRPAPPAIVLPQVGGPVPASPYLPDAPAGVASGPVIAQPTGPAVPGRDGGATDGEAVTDGGHAGAARSETATLPSGLPAGAGFQGTSTALSPDELIEQLKELARRPDILSETAGPAIIREAARPPITPSAEDGASEDGEDGQP